MKTTPATFAKVLEIVEAVPSWKKVKDNFYEGSACGVGVMFAMDIMGVAKAGTWDVRIDSGSGQPSFISVGYPVLPFGRWKAEAELYRKLEALAQGLDACAKQDAARNEVENLENAVAKIRAGKEPAGKGDE